MILVTVGRPTCGELAQIMQQMERYRQMDIDASSGLYRNGQRITRLDRDLSKALHFLRK